MENVVNSKPSRSLQFYFLKQYLIKKFKMKNLKLFGGGSAFIANSSLLVKY